MGVILHGVTAAVVQRNVLWANDCGLAMTGVLQSRVERNEIVGNRFDGLDVSHGANRVETVENCIRGHDLWGHPDNIQFHSTARSGNSRCGATCCSAAGRRS